MNKRLRKSFIRRKYVVECSGVEKWTWNVSLRNQCIEPSQSSKTIRNLFSDTVYAPKWPYFCLFLLSRKFTAAWTKGTKSVFSYTRKVEENSSIMLMLLSFTYFLSFVHKEGANKGSEREVASGRKVNDFDRKILHFAMFFFLFLLCSTKEQTKIWPFGSVNGIGE